MIDYAALQDLVYTDRLYDSSVHGLSHWRQVEFNALLMAPENGADITVVRLFAIFHDSKRLEDSYDETHGKRGAEFAKKCREEKLFEITDEQFEKLYHACANHTTEKCSGDPTIDTCYDADRLDLGRVGIFPAAEKMASGAGKKIARKLKAASVSCKNHRDWIRNFSF